MAFYRSRRPEPQLDLATAEQELERSDRGSLKILAVIAVIVAAGLWFYSTTINTPIARSDNPALPPVQTTTGAAVGEGEIRKDLPAKGDNRETVVQPKPALPTEQ